MESVSCPRRMLESGPWSREEGLDQWRPDETCSFCGSLNPETVLARAEQGEEITPTDKNYKGYLGKSKKFYFQHFDQKQKEKFIELLNGRKLTLAHPGYFYVLPFFVKVELSQSEFTD